MQTKRICRFRASVCRFSIEIFLTIASLVNCSRKKSLIRCFIKYESKYERLPQRNGVTFGQNFGEIQDGGALKYNTYSRNASQSYVVHHYIMDIVVDPWDFTNYPRKKSNMQQLSSTKEKKKNKKRERERRESNQQQQFLYLKDRTYVRC